MVRMAKREVKLKEDSLVRRYWYKKSTVGRKKIKRKRPSFGQLIPTKKIIEKNIATKERRIGN